MAEMRLELTRAALQAAKCALRVPGRRVEPVDPKCQREIVWLRVPSEGVAP